MKNNRTHDNDSAQPNKKEERAWANQMRQNTRVMQIHRALNALPPGKFLIGKQLGEIAAVSRRAVIAYIKHMRDGLFLPIVDDTSLVAR